MKLSETKESAKEWIENGGKCIYRFGYGWKGASGNEISKEDALKILKYYSFGKGFYELSWSKFKGDTVLEFNELSENDMW